MENPRAAHEELLFLQYCTIWSQSGQTHVSDHDHSASKQKFFATLCSAEHVLYTALQCSILAMVRSSAEEGLSHSCYIIAFM